MASRKKAEDKNLTILRELVSQPHNKKCFDCRQRGPTYVNMTIGGFVCTSCSGMLRGLNPPHRIKSISMASFNDQEIAFLQKHGNEVCRQSWLGLWNSQLPPEPESRDEQKVKDFLVKKYERRTWYTSQPRPKSPTPAPEAKPLKQLLGDNAPKMVVHGQSPSHSQQSTASQPTAVARRPTALQSQPPAFTLLGDLGADPFGNSGKPSPQKQAASNPATFDAFASSPTATASFAAFGQQQPQQSNVPFDAFASSPPRQSSGSFTAFTSAAPPQQPLADLFSGSSTSAVNGVGGPPSSAALSGGDKYSALSDLDDLFRSSNTSSVFSSQTNSNGPSHAQHHQQQQKQQPQQQQHAMSNSQPNPFMSPASGASGVAMFQQQQQKPANPFHQGGFPSAQQSQFGMQQQAGFAQSAQQQAGFAQSAQQQASFAQSTQQQASFAQPAQQQAGFAQPAQQQMVSQGQGAQFGGANRSWAGTSASMMQQQAPQAQMSNFQGGMIGQNAAFANFGANQGQMAPLGNQMQPQQQFPGNMGMGASQVRGQFPAVPQGYQQQPQGFPQQQFQFAAAQQQGQGFQTNQFQAAPTGTGQQGNAGQLGGLFGANMMQQQQQQQPLPQKMTPQQFAGWGTAPNQSSVGMQQAPMTASHQQQRSSTNPFM